MKRICFVGNSHLAAIKLGWDEIASSTPGIEAIFFGAPQPISNTLAYRDGALHIDDGALAKIVNTGPAGGASIALDGFDAVVFCGLGIGPLSFIRLYRTYRSDGQAGAVSPDYVNHILSEPVYKETCIGLVARTSAARLAMAVRKEMGVPAWVIPAAYPAASILLSVNADTVRDMLNCGDDDAIAGAFEASLQAFAQTGIGAVSQPEETKSAPLFTDERYSSGSVRLVGNVEHKSLDYVHMNGSFGALVLNSLFARLGDAKGVRVQAAA